MAQKKKKSKIIYFGHYRLYADGTVERLKKGKGTWIGRMLTPYTNPTTDQYYVRLCAGGNSKQYSIEFLLSYYFG